jgi:hypothetical protein
MANFALTRDIASAEVTPHKGKIDVAGKAPTGSDSSLYQKQATCDTS